MRDLNGARLLVTGGTGSFGNALIDYLHDSGAEFVVYSRDETKQHEMYISRQDRRIAYVIGDVRDREKLTQTMRGVDYVVHAAALKHVPTGEKWPEEVIQTNVLGTKNVVDAAEYCDVKALVNLSCYDEQTRLFTKDGLKYWYELKVGDVVFGVTTNDILEEQPVLDVITQEYNGKMCEFRGRRTDLLVTPNHRMFYLTATGNMKVVRADECERMVSQLRIPQGAWTDRDSKGRFRVKTGPVTRTSFFSSQRFYNLRKRHNMIPYRLPTKELYYLTGLFISDGFLNSDNSIVLCIPRNDPANRKAKLVLESWGLPIHFIDNHGGFLEFSSRALHEFWASCGKGAANKCIPNWMLESSKELLNSLLEGLIDGDGYRQGKLLQYTTVSKKLARDVVELYIKLGLSPYIATHPAEKITIGDHQANGSEAYYVYGSATPKYIQTANARQVDYSGKVWCVRVQTGNVLVERNGKFAICGNTDKAAYPIGAYGMSKALAEKVALAHSGKTKITCLRYGNVLGSRGSIIPLFLGFIAQGKPITITNPNMTRFVLTLEEAVKLSLRCLLDGKDGELFIMRPPACKVETVVDALELHFGKKLDRQVIGIRPGEKMHEVLLTGAEVYRAVDEIEDGITYSRIPPQRDLDYYFSGEDYTEPEPFSSDKATQLNAERVLDKLKEARLL